MSRGGVIIIPEIDNELEIEVPAWDIFCARFHMAETMKELSVSIDAVDYYYQYMIEKLSGLTEKKADEWLLDKLNNRR